MATRAQVRDRIGNLLGILRFGQSLQSQDSARLYAAYDEVYQQLKTDGSATWTSTGIVPDEFVQHVAALAAENCMNEYGISNDRYVRIQNAAEKAKKEIPKLVANINSNASQDEATDF